MPFIAELALDYLVISITCFDQFFIKLAEKVDNDKVLGCVVNWQDQSCRSCLCLSAHTLLLFLVWIF